MLKNFFNKKKLLKKNFAKEIELYEKDSKFIVKYPKGYYGDVNIQIYDSLDEADERFEFLSKD